MKARIMLAVTVLLAIAGPVAASAQSVDDLLKDHALLHSELDRCKQMGMASNDDARCKNARAAEQNRFFGSGQDKYTPTGPQVYPSAPVPDPKMSPQLSGSPPNG
jgi:conjugative transfer region protein TrbK